MRSWDAIAGATLLFRILLGGASLLLGSPRALAAERDLKISQTLSPTIEPPQVRVDAGAIYPMRAITEGVRSSAQVLVLIDISAEGRVTTAVVPEPVGHGFDQAAIEAAKALEFRPAMRAGKPVSVRIKYRYEFVPPRGRLRGVVRASEKPLAKASVRIVRPDGTVQPTTTNVAGEWRADDVPFGKVRVEVLSEGYKSQVIEEDLAPAQELTVTSRLERLSLGSGVEPELEEVNVRGSKPPREVTRRTIEAREITRVPGTGGDALRSIQNLPGIARPPGLAGLLIVRGSSPQDTNIFVDGTLIPIVYHFGGLTSVIPTQLTDKADLNLIEKIDFYPGNFSAQYGRVMGGIVDVGVRSPKSDGNVHTTGGVDIIDGRFLVQAPVFSTGWTATLAARRSWVDFFLKPVLEASGAGVTTAPVYYDYQAILNRDFSKNQSVRFFFFGSDDRLEILTKTLPGAQPAAGGNLSAHTGFWRMQGRYRQRVGDTELRVTSAVGKDIVDFAFGDLSFTLDSTPITVRAEVGQRISPQVTMNLGVDWLSVPYDVSVRAPPAGRPGEPPSGPFLSLPPVVTQDSGWFHRPGAFLEFEAVPFRGGRIVPGVRLDYSHDTGEWDLGPRVMARQDLPTTQRTTIKSGLGIFMQPPQPQESNAVLGQVGLRSNRAVHYSLGVEREFNDTVELSVEGFYKELDSLVVARAGNAGRGRAFGVETLLRWKPRGRFFGWLAYTLMRSERQDLPGQPWRETPFDQTHILTVLGSYQLGSGWEVGGRFRLVSGNLITPQQYGFYDANAGVYLPMLSYPPYTERLPLFHQLDIRVDKTWRLGQRGNIHIYLDVINAYNQGNVEGVTYNYNSTKRAYATGLPFIPNFGLSWEY